jgi:hypothetical protein
MLRQVITSTTASAIAGTTAHVSSVNRRGEARTTERAMTMWATRHVKTAAQKSSWAGKAGTITKLWRGER